MTSLARGSLKVAPENAFRMESKNDRVEKMPIHGEGPMGHPGSPCLAAGDKSAKSSSLHQGRIEENFWVQSI